MLKKSSIIFILFLFINIFYCKQIFSTTMYNSPSNTYVFITSKKGYYHTMDCKYLGNNYHKVSLEYSLAIGLSPCPYCNPYLEAENYEDYYYYGETYIVIGVAIIVIVASVLLFYFIKKRKIKKNHEMVNLDDYNIVKDIKKQTPKQPENVTNNKIENKNVIEKKIPKQPQYSVNENKELPMAWYSFCIYFRIPMGIFLNVLNLFTFEFTAFNYNKPYFGIFLLDIFYLTYIIITYINLKKKTKKTVTLITILSILEGFFTLFNELIEKGFDFTNFCTITIVASIFTILNYIYFNKRRNIFIN